MNTLYAGTAAGFGAGALFLRLGGAPTRRRLLASMEDFRSLRGDEHQGAALGRLARHLPQRHYSELRGDAPRFARPRRSAAAAGSLGDMPKLRPKVRLETSPSARARCWIPTQPFCTGTTTREGCAQRVCHRRAGAHFNDGRKPWRDERSSLWRARNTPEILFAEGHALDRFSRASEAGKQYQYDPGVCLFQALVGGCAAATNQLPPGPAYSSARIQAAADALPFSTPPAGRKTSKRPLSGEPHHLRVPAPRWIPISRPCGQPVKPFGDPRRSLTDGIVRALYRNSTAGGPSRSKW